MDKSAARLRLLIGSNNKVRNQFVGTRAAKAVPARHLWALSIASATLLSACGGGQDAAIAVPQSAKGLWQGTTTDSNTGSVQEIYGAVSPDGSRAMFATFLEAQDPAVDRAVNVIWADVAQNGALFTATGTAFAGATLMSYAVSDGNVASGLLSGQFTKATLSPATTLSSGVLNAKFKSASNRPVSLGQLAGTFANNELRLVVTSAGGLAGEGLQGSQIGGCTFSAGQLDAAGGVNVHTGTIVLDTAADPDCVTRSADPANNSFEVLAYALDTADCDGTSPDTLVLGMTNGLTASYFHRLCRDAGTAEGE